MIQRRLETILKKYGEDFGHDFNNNERCKNCNILHEEFIRNKPSGKIIPIVCLCEKVCEGEIPKRMVSTKLTISEDNFLKLLKEFDLEEKKINRARIYHSFTSTRKYFLDKHKMRRPEFDMLFVMVADPWIKNQISCSGGPTGFYKKDNWLELRKKHYLQWCFN